MKRRKRKSKTLKILRITILLLLAAIIFIPNQINRSVIAGIAITGIAGSFLFLLIPLLSHISIPIFRRNSSIQQNHKSKKQKRKGRITDIETFLLRQISFQITDKIKSAYPEASWEFVKPPKAKLLLNGRAFRLRTFHTGDYNFAEVTIDRYGHLCLSMMTITALNPEARQDASDMSNSSEHVDPEAWYSLIGKPLLTELIGDLQARGHQKLFINETGDIFVLNGSTPEVKSTFPHFPPKNYWAMLTDIFIRDELQAKETDDTLELSWA